MRSAFYTILLQPISNDCLNTLTSELGIHDEDAMQKAKSYLQEDLNIVQIRNDLLVKKATLSQALNVINAFWSGSLKVDS